MSPLRSFTLGVLMLMTNGTLPVMATTLNGQHVPEMSVTALDGTAVDMSPLRGTVVLINFWGTWCGPCLQEIPELVRLSHRFNTRGFEVVGIALDSGSAEDIREFMMEHQMDYRVLIGDMACIKRRFRVVGFPTSLLVDRQGLIRHSYFGPQTEETLTKDITPLLE